MYHGRQRSPVVHKSLVVERSALEARSTAKAFWHSGIPFGHGAAGSPHTASPWSSTSSGLDAYHLHIFFIPLNRGSSTPR